MYCSSRATSALSTYLPISRRNCSIEVYGRYSLNSRSIRGPMPGIARIWASVAVLMLIRVIVPVELAVVPVEPLPAGVDAVVEPVGAPVADPVAGVVVVDDVAAIEVSAAIAVVSAALPDL